jgi:hypothetical protein
MREPGGNLGKGHGKAAVGKHGDGRNLILRRRFCGRYKKHRGHNDGHPGKAHDIPHKRTTSYSHKQAVKTIYSGFKKGNHGHFWGKGLS